MSVLTGVGHRYLGGASVKKVADLMNGVDGVQSLGHSPSSVSSDTSGDYAARGMVRVVGDLDSDDAPTTVAYFRATADGRPIGAMAFDPLGKCRSLSSPIAILLDAISAAAVLTCRGCGHCRNATGDDVGRWPGHEHLLAVVGDGGPSQPSGPVPRVRRSPPASPSR